MIRLISLFVFLISSVGFAEQILTLKYMTDDEVRQAMINESTNDYAGNCACPYFVNAGSTRRCGEQSAYTRRGGGSPLCYKQDISNDMLTRYKRSHQTLRLAIKD